MFIQLTILKNRSKKWKKHCTKISCKLITSYAIELSDLTEWKKIRKCIYEIQKNKIENINVTLNRFTKFRDDDGMWFLVYPLDKMFTHEKLKESTIFMNDY